MKLNRHDVWGHFAPMFHLVDVFAVYAITLVGGRHVTIPAFAAQDALLTIGAHSRLALACPLAAALLGWLGTQPLGMQPHCTFHS